MATQEEIAQEYTLSKYGQMSDLYNAMCNEIALLRNLADDAVKGEPSTTYAPDPEYKKIVYVKVRGKKEMEVHNYNNSTEEDNAAIIANVKKDMKEAKIDVENVFVVEKA